MRLQTDFLTMEAMTLFLHPHKPCSWGDESSPPEPLVSTTLKTRIFSELPFSFINQSNHATFSSWGLTASNTLTIVRTMQIPLMLAQRIPRLSQQEEVLVFASSEEIKSFDTKNESPLSSSN